MPTLINAVAGNSDAWEPSHSVNIDVGAASADRRIVGLVGRFTDATERITAASQITLGGSSTGVTLAGTATNPTGQAGSFYARWFDIAVPAGLSGVQALAAAAGDATARRIFIIAACYSDGGAPTFSYGSNSFNNNPTATISSATGEEVGLLVFSITAGTTLTPGTGSSAITGASGGTNISLFGLRENGAASVTIDGTFPGSDEYCCVAFTLPSAGPAASVEQEGARFGVDDGGESAHTWAEAQDANLTSPVGTARLIRALLNGTGDFASTAFTLRYQKNGAGGYVAVPVGASVAEQYGTVTFGAIGTGANGSTSVAPSYPAGITAGQYLTCHVSSGATNSETPSTPSGWTLLATGASTDGTYGIDTGPRRMTVFGKVADGTESGTLTVNITNGGTCRGSIARWTKSGSGAWVVGAQGGNDSTSGTGFSVTFGSMNWNTGDAALVAVGQRVDTVTQSAQSLTASGVTFGTRTNRESTAVTTGNDHRHVVDTFAAVSGTSNVNAAPTWAYTGSAACSGGAVVVRLREYTAPVTNELYIATSSNIAAGGEATTARLTAPAGKSTSDFVTGRRWDDENGSDSIDLTTDDYTEVEWCINTQSPAADGDYFDFRVYAGAAALGTYTVTPRLTLGTPFSYTPRKPARGGGAAAMFWAGRTSMALRRRGMMPSSILATFLSAAVAEVANAVDTLSASVTFGVAIAEVGSATDAAGAAVQTAAAIAEVVSAIESLSASLSTPAVMAETLSAADTQDGSSSNAAVIAETMSATDSLSAAAALLASIAESLTAADSVTAAGTLAGAVAEVLAAVDAVTAALSTAAAIVESGSAADATDATIGTITAAVTESGSATDAVSATAALDAAVAEVSAATATLLATLGAAASIIESASAVDLVSADGAVVNASVAESGAATDTTQGSVTYQATIVEVAAAAEAYTALLAAAAQVLEAGSAADLFSAAAALSAAVAESAAVADNYASGAIIVNVSEVLSAVDFWDWLKAVRVLRVTAEQRSILIAAENRVFAVGLQDRSTGA